jgi:hypothetical protein
MFSRWKGEKDGEAAAGSAAPTGSGSGAPAPGWPWEPDQSVAARLAMSSLVKFFPKSLTQNGRLQGEALFCAIGALTGFAAQYAVRQESRG